MNDRRSLFKLWFIPFFIINTFFFGFISVIASNRSPAYARRLASIWARINLRVSNVTVDLEGKEHIPEDRIKGPSGFIIASSHSSAADIPAIFAGLPLDLCIVAKASLLKIPVVGRHIKRVQIPIVRGRSGSAKQFIRTGLERLKSGVSVVIFPEGTWNEGDEKLIPFKKGAFLLARVSNRPVIPVAIIGSRNVLPPDKWVPDAGVITVRIGRLIEPSRFPGRKPDLLSEETFKALSNLIPD